MELYCLHSGVQLEPFPDYRCLFANITNIYYTKKKVFFA